MHLPAKVHVPILVAAGAWVIYTGNFILMIVWTAYMLAIAAYHDNK